MFSPKPKIIIIDGVKTPVDPDFRIMCEYSEAVSRNDSSGLAGIAYWINQHYKLAGTPREVDKRDPMVVSIKEWVDAEYESGRQSNISTHELESLITELSGGAY